MNGPNGIRAASLAFFAAMALQAPAFAEESWNPQEEARIERLIEQAIQGNGDADRQEEARIDRLVQQALQRADVQSSQPSRERFGGSVGIVAQSGWGTTGR